MDLYRILDSNRYRTNLRNNANVNDREIASHRLFFLHNLYRQCKEQREKSNIISEHGRDD